MSQAISLLKPTVSLSTASGLPIELHFGECVQLLRELPSNSVDAVITDPPYSSGGLHASARAHSPTQKYQNGGTQRVYPEFDGDSKDQRSWMLWCQLWLLECYRIAKPSAPICIFTDWRQLPATTDVLQIANFVWRGVAPWDKGGGCRPTMGRFTAQAEFVVWGSKGDMPRERGVGCLPGVFRHGVKQSDKHHVTGKPSDLMSEVVRICKPGGTVLDPFMGSGTTGVGCVPEGYGFVGIEQERSYFDISHHRIAEAVQEKDAAYAALAPISNLSGWAAPSGVLPAALAG